MPPTPLRILLFQDLPGRWSARSLEHDFAVEGRTIEIVLDRILQLIYAHTDFDRRHGRAPLSTFPAAPRCFWEMFERARPLRSVIRPALHGQAYAPILIAVTDERPRVLRHLRPVRTLRRPSFAVDPGDRMTADHPRHARGAGRPH